MRIDFLVYFDRELPGDYEYVAVGHELVTPISIDGAEAHYEVIGPKYARVRSRFSKHLELYDRLGELLLRRDQGRLEEMAAALKGEAHRYHPLLVADYRTRKGTPSPIDDMATAFHVDRTTIYRHLRQAVVEGLIPLDELPR